MRQKNWHTDDCAKSKESTMAEVDNSVQVHVTPFGPTPQHLAEIGRSVLLHDAVKKMIGRGHHRLFGVEAVDPEAGDRKTARRRKPERFRTTIYEDAGSRTVLAE